MRERIEAQLQNGIKALRAISERNTRALRFGIQEVEGKNLPCG